jgi:hypothetical protein
MGRMKAEMWLESRGGPFVVMGLAKCLKWRGDEDLSTTIAFPPVGNDYTRAARFRAHEGVLSDADGEVFVFFSEGLCAQLWNSQEGFGVISWELSGRESLEDFITFKSENLKNGRTIFDFFISEDKLTMVSGEIANFSDLDSYITVKTGWYKLRKYDLDLGNVDKFGKFLCYRFENS